MFGLWKSRSEKVLALRQKAAVQISDGRLEKALRSIDDALELSEDDEALLGKRAELLCRTGDRNTACEVYAQLASRYDAQGHHLRAVAMNKQILHLDPKSASARQALAALYSKMRVASAGPGVAALAAAPRRRAPPRAASVRSAYASRDPSLQLDISVVEEALEQAGIEVEASEREAVPFGGFGNDASIEIDLDSMREALADDDEGALDKSIPIDLSRVENARADHSAERTEPAEPLETTARMPTIPLVAEMGREAFATFVGLMTLREEKADTKIITEGESGDSMFILIEGVVEVVRESDELLGDPHIARLEDGAFFGEIALLADVPRTASVRTTTDCVLFEVNREALKRLTEEHPDVAGAIDRYYKDRLLTSLLAVSSLFEPLPREARAELARRFVSVDRGPDEVVLRQGDPAASLYMLLRGRCASLHETKDGRTIKHADVEEGDFFGEAPLLLRQPAPTTIRTRTRCTLLRLERDHLREVVLPHREIWKRLLYTAKVRLASVQESEH